MFQIFVSRTSERIRYFSWENSAFSQEYDTSCEEIARFPKSSFYPRQNYKNTSNIFTGSNFHQGIIEILYKITLTKNNHGGNWPHSPSTSAPELSLQFCLSQRTEPNQFFFLFSVWVQFEIYLFCLVRFVFWFS